MHLTKSMGTNIKKKLEPIIINKTEKQKSKTWVIIV